MEIQSMVDFLRNKTILVTGATGFLAKILVEKILRVQPNVGKLYLLLRAKSDKPVIARLHDEIISKDLFSVLREKQGVQFESFISQKLAPIAGDTSLPDLGITDISNLCNEVDVIIHVAATTTFYERYDWALDINTFGVRNVVEFAKKCPKLKILIHVSTAYVCGNEKGLVREKPCKMGEALNGRTGLNIDEERKLIEKSLNNLNTNGASHKNIRDAMRRLGHQRANYYGWPNTYVFTKAMGEMLLAKHRQDLPVAVIRPTMICSTYKEPFPGWVESVGSVAAVSIIYGKGMANFMHADINSIFDLIPADMVVNTIVAAMVANAKRPNLTIYQVGSSLKNPVKFGQLLDLNLKYFTKNPWIDGQGNPVMLPNWSDSVVKSKIFFILLLALLFLKLLMLKFVYMTSGNNIELNHTKLERRLKATVKVAEIFRPYLFFAGIFDNKNTEQLRIATSSNNINGKEEHNEERLEFDPSCINWEDYLFNIHIPATVKYLFNI